MASPRKPGVDFMDDPRERDRVIIWNGEVAGTYGGTKKYRAVAVRGTPPKNPSIPIYITVEYYGGLDAMGRESWRGTHGELDSFLIYEIAKRDKTLPTWAKDVVNGKLEKSDDATEGSS